jgi:hypothetical protein
MRPSLLGTALALAGAVAGAAALTGCGALDPYPTYPLAASHGVTVSDHRVAICYNSLKTSLPEVRVAAQQECAADYPRTVAEPVETDWYLQNCPLLLPARATFACAPAKR